jgi:hypothetical protein
MIDAPIEVLSRIRKLERGWGLEDSLLGALGSRSGNSLEKVKL